MKQSGGGSAAILTRTFEGALWSALGHTAQSALSILAVAVIASVVKPETYGLFGAAMLIISTGEIITGGALAQCLIQRKEINDGHADTTFWMNMVLASALAGLVILLAGPFLAVLQAPQARPALLCLAAMMLVNAAGAVPQALLMREMHLKLTTRAGLIANTTAAATGISAALLGWGLWSLIAMECVRSVLRTVSLWTACTWRPGRRGSFAQVRELSGFNLSVLVTSALGRADQLVPRAIVASLLGPQALGVWLLARRLVEEVSTISTVPLNAVAMSAIARCQSDLDQVRQVVTGLYRASSLIGLPVYAGLIAIAPWLIPVMFGNAWQAAVLPMQILLLAGLRTCTGVFNVSILRGMGLHALPMFLLITGVLANVILMPTLGNLYWPGTNAMTLGVTGISIAWLLRNLLTWPLGCVFIKRATGMPVRLQLNAATTPAIAAGLMALSVYTMMMVLEPQVGSLAGLVSSVVLGAAIYVTLIYWISPVQAKQLLGLLSAVRSRDRARLARLLGEPAYTVTT